MNEAWRCRKGSWEFTQQSQNRGNVYVDLEWSFLLLIHFKLLLIVLTGNVTYCVALVELSACLVVPALQDCRELAQTALEAMIQA